jgi:hypothetical protein
LSGIFPVLTHLNLKLDCKVQRLLTDEVTMKRVSISRSLFVTMILLIVLAVSSCVQGTAKRVSKGTKNAGITQTGNSNGNGSGAIDTTTDTTTDGTITSQRVELSHLVDPFDGTYKKKLTIPKNYKGSLYLAGLNVSALVDRIIYVRFNFGKDKQSVTLNATVARAPGIVPKTDIQVLVIDMNSKPFQRMTLPYDLYDYNDYSDPTKAMVTDPRDGGLYCRGLKLEDDPTFIPLTNTSTCSGASDKCLYSYAKVVDSTLYYDQVVNGITYSNLSSIPTKPAVWTENGGVHSPSYSTFAKSACLPDDSGVSTLNYLFGTNHPSIAYDLSIFGTLPAYNYRGPYRSIDDDSWQISSSAVYNSTFGLFELQSPLTSMTTGFHSFLFPRAGKIGLSQGVNYLGSATDRIGARAPMTSDSTGTTQYVDGCNLRVQNYDPSSNEGINSCNVDSTIEVFYMKDGKEVNITTDKSIKLQLIRPSITNFEGKAVLTTSFKRCDNSSTCGSDECCFNSRCWSKDLVTQCVDNTPVIGNQEIGANCSSDFECSSLCCNQATGSCTPHNPNGTTPIFCSKTAGQQCVSKEFCAQEPVVTCKIVKSGFNADGTAACTLRCPAVMTYGDCKGGVCIPPVQPAVPAFDPTDCSKAVDP